MAWNNIVIEGFCFGENIDGKYPCGCRYPTAFCLNNKHCPHFGYSASTERMASYFVPLNLILWDRLKCYAGEIWGKVTWFVWDKWFFEKKWAEFRDGMKVADCTTYNEIQGKHKNSFPSWFKRAKKEDVQHS